MIGCLRTCVRKQPIIALYFELETGLKFYNIEARSGSNMFDTDGISDFFPEKLAFGKKVRKITQHAKR